MRTGGRLRAASDGRLFVEALAVTETARERRTGLLGRDGLGRGEALWIRPCRSIHTVGMRFPIDAVYLDRELTVVKVVVHLRPWRLSACLGAESVLELPAGAAARAGFAIGERVVEERAEGRAG